MPAQSKAQATPTPAASRQNEPVRPRGIQPRGNAAAQERLAGVQVAPRRGPLPFRAQLEKSFGADLGDIEAVFGGGSGGRTGQAAGAPPSGKPNLAAGGGAGLPADAATDGRVVWFRNPNPSLEQAAHEVAHVLQHRQGAGGAGTSRKGDASEREAEQVAKDASAGKPAKVQQSAGAALHGDWWDTVQNTVGDALNLRDDEAQRDIDEDISDFKSHDYGPITYTRGNVSGSGFEASYAPNAETLTAEVRAKLRFADSLVNNGGTVSSPNEFMNRGQIISTLNTFPDLRDQVLPYFQWGEDEKEVHKLRFYDNIAATIGLWENTGMSFQVDRTGWEGVVARPDIQINVTEGEAVTTTEDYGPFGILTRTDEQGSDHLQIEMVKKLNATDAATVNGLITTYLAANAPATAAPPAGDAQGVRAYLGNDSGSRASNPSGHNNFMSLESDRSDDPVGRTFEHTVQFNNNEATIGADEQRRLDMFLADPMVLLQNPNGTVNIALSGYASAAGSTRDNEALVNERLTHVAGAINTKRASSTLNVTTDVDPATQFNDADTSAERDRGADPATYRRVDIYIEHSGRGGQNVIAHEFGHVFGLGDEYAEVGNGYNRPAGTKADHDGLAVEAGVPSGAVVGNDNRMMSTGNQVGAAHYSTFADALKKLTSAPWKVV